MKGWFQIFGLLPVLLLSSFCAHAERSPDRFKNHAFYLPSTAVLSSPPKKARMNGLVSSAMLNVSLDKLHSRAWSASAFGISLNGLRDANTRGSRASSFVRQRENILVKLSVGRLRKVGALGAAGVYRIATVSDQRKKTTGVYGTFEQGGTILVLRGRTTDNNINLKLERWKQNKIVDPGCAVQQEEDQLPITAKTKSPFTLIDYLSIKEVTLLTAYTQKVLTQISSKEAVEAQIAFKISEANQVFENSNIPVALKMDCPPVLLTGEEHDNSGAVNVAMIKGDGVWDELHQLRSDCKADLVHVFQAGTWGAAKVPHEPIPFSSAVSASQALGRLGFGCSVIGGFYVASSPHFPHEIGHNFGAGHDAETIAPGEDPNKLGLLPTSHGHRFTGLDNKNYFTTMTYREPGEIYTKTYSDPLILHQGVPTGTESANNAGTIRYLAETVSQYGENIVYPVGITINVELIKAFEDSKTTLRTTISGDLTQPVLQKEELVGWQNLPAQKFSQIIGSTKAAISEGPIFDTVLDFPGNYFASLDPDRDVISNEVTNPSWSTVSISLSNQGLVLNGSVNYGISPTPEIKGNWIGIYRAPFGTTDYVLIGTTSVVGGEFTYTATEPGLYKAAFTKSNGVVFTNFVIVY